METVGHQFSFDICTFGENLHFSCLKSVTGGFTTEIQWLTLEDFKAMETNRWTGWNQQIFDVTAKDLYVVKVSQHELCRGAIVSILPLWSIFRAFSAFVEYRGGLTERISKLHFYLLFWSWCAWILILSRKVVQGFTEIGKPQLKKPVAASGKIHSVPLSTAYQLKFAN